jgi:acyl-CoA synthetase (NDP forming)
MTPAQERIARLLKPASIAVVGASAAMNKLAGQLIPTLQASGYGGTIYPVNPRYEKVSGLPCYKSLDDVHGPIDHCVIVVGRERLLSVLATCRKLGVGGASIFSSGFAEAGEDGAAAQEELVRQAGDMAFIGPNCMGFANVTDKVVATTSSLMRHDATPGDIAVASQSGGIAFAAIGFRAYALGQRFSHVINTGNSAGISYTEITTYFFNDPATRVILIAAESEKVVGEVIAAVKREGLRKPIVMLKLGRGETGVRMAFSHTGSLAGDWRVVRDVAEQAGIVCAEDVDDALGCCELLRRGFGPQHAGGLAALCISGGNVALLADQMDKHGIDFAPLAAETEATLREALPDFISVHNPIDITALGMEEPALFRRVLELAAQDATVKVVVPIMTSATDYTPTARLLAEVKAKGGAPMIVLWTGGSLETRSPEILREAGIPIFYSASLMGRCLEQLKRVAPPQGDDLPVAAPKASALPHGGTLTEGESLAVLEAAGVPVPRWRLSARDDLARVAEEVGYPIVIKAETAETHISDRGAVLLGLRGPEDLAREAARIAALPGETLLVSRFLPGRELIVSTFHHDHFGTLLMVGSGGQMVELQSDVRFVALPASRARLADALSGTLIGGALRKKFRGAEGFDAAVDFLQRVAALALASAGGIAQIELNPVTVGAHGAAAVDASIVVR